MKFKAKVSDGFTLVEVLVALAAMAIAFTALWGLHFSSLSAEMRNRHEEEALHWANEQIERMRSLPLPLASGNDQVSIPGRQTYTRQWTVTRPRPWRYEVTVLVTWSEPVRSLGSARAYISRSVRLSTIISDLT